ncbi:lipase member I-like [Trichoplusia ni]|uniref:Lipase member I-like n=1 Tax=Trichoplusia ni TaxID=7111 RepID=A0A7E5X3N9_TRINI|nr:lipase member I-like [Trichoplusia ni]
MLGAIAIVCFAIGAVTALPEASSLRYQYVQDAEGVSHLVDFWDTKSDLSDAARYNPTTENIYHLFTRNNPSVSQPLLHGNTALLSNSNFNPSKKTVILIHGWRTNVTGLLGSVMIPALLQGGDVNVIGLDWSAGASTINYLAAMANTVTSGAAVAAFISWLNSATGASLSSYHIIGHSLGGQQVGIVGRNLDGQLPYITSLDPTLAGWITNPDSFNATDAVYTEVIHTNAGVNGVLLPAGDVDFYPNGGVVMTGCSGNYCSHDRGIYYMAESVISGGFTGRECSTYVTAISGDCDLPGSLKMGGWEPKTGVSGIYRVDTNDSPPFSMD